MAWWDRQYREAARWREETLNTLLSVLPEAPWQLGTALSFLQPQPVDLKEPVRLDLFFHTLPLAVDLLWERDLPDWRKASRHWPNRQLWERSQASLAHKSLTLGAYRCPYLQLWRHESSTRDALRERLLPLLGRLPD